MSLIATCVIVDDRADPPLRLEEGETITEKALADAGWSKDNIAAFIEDEKLVTKARYEELQEDHDA